LVKWKLGQDHNGNRLLRCCIQLAILLLLAAEAAEVAEVELVGFCLAQVL
jgi:hypothetical protein